MPGWYRSSDLLQIKVGWGEKGIEKSADFSGQWGRYPLKFGNLGSVSGLCFVLWLLAAHTNSVFAALFVKQML